MIASIAEPAMLMIVFTLALIAGSTQLSTMAAFMISSAVGLRVSLGLALIALVMVALAENGRIPIDNPATHLELTMVHEAMVLEYSGRHLALIELAAALKLLLYVSLIACVFVPWGIADAARHCALIVGVAAYVVKLAVGGCCWRCSRRRSPKCGCSACPNFLGAALMLGLLGRCCASSRGLLMTDRFRHRPSARRPLVLVSFLELYQDRLYALLNVFALHALVLAVSVAWQASFRMRPIFMSRPRWRWSSRPSHPIRAAPIIVRLGIHREIETAVSVGSPCSPASALVALTMVVMLRVTQAPIRWRARISPSRFPSCCSAS